MQDVEDLAPNVKRYGWRGLVLRGLAAIAFGVLAVALPFVTARVLLALFAAFMIAHGVVDLRRRRERPRGAHRGAIVVRGFLAVAAGVVAALAPNFSEVALVILAGVWAVVAGVAEFAVAGGTRRVVPGMWMLMATGLASIVFGAWIAVRPTRGVVALVWLAAVYVFLYGVMTLVMGIVAYVGHRSSGAS